MSVCWFAPLAGTGNHMLGFIFVCEHFAHYPAYVIITKKCNPCPQKKHIFFNWCKTNLIWFFTVTHSLLSRGKLVLRTIDGLIEFCCCALPHYELLYLPPTSREKEKEKKNQVIVVILFEWVSLTLLRSHTWGCFSFLLDNWYRG